MRHLFAAILLISLSGSLFGQKAKNNDDLKINGISFVADKATILNIFGKPLRQFAPHYECSFLADQPGETFYTLQYKSFNWTGNKKRGYQLEGVLILPNSLFKITYKEKLLSNLISARALMDITGVHKSAAVTGVANPPDLIKRFKDPHLITTCIQLQYKGADDKYIFYFFKDRLCKIEYRSPC